MNDKIRLALVGLNFGRHIAESELLHGSGADFIQLAGICDLDREKARRAAELYHVKQFLSLEEILADPSIEAVALYTPPRGRAALIGMILDAGKSVMTTKPFEDDPVAAERVLRLAREKGLVLHLNSPAPEPDGDFRMIGEWRKKYDLGRPVLAFWETHARYDERADGSWMDDPAKCPAAPLFRLGIYGINDLIYLCGPARSCRLVESRTETGRPTADSAMLTVNFENGCLGCIASSFRIGNGSPYTNSLLLHYERGTITRALPFRREEGVVALELQRKNADGSIHRETASVSEWDRSGQYQWNEFYRSVRNHETIREEYIGRILNSITLIGEFTAQSLCLSDDCHLRTELSLTTGMA